MAWRTYYRRWISVAFWHAWGASDAISTAMGIFVPFVAWKWPGNAMNDPAWQLIPFGALVSLVGARLLLAPWWMSKEDEQKHQGDLKDMVAEADRKYSDILAKLDTCEAQLATSRSELGSLRTQIDAKRATCHDVWERARQLAREGASIIDRGQQASPKDADRWKEKALAFVRLAFRKSDVEDFQKRVNAQSSQAENEWRRRLSECVQWLNGWDGGKLTDGHVNPKCLASECE